jgi:hypothetical protein
MLAVALIVLATALLGAVADAVVESAIAGGDAIVAFGRTLVSPGPAGTLGILTAASAVAVLAWVAAIAHTRGRRLERRLTDELDERWEDLSQRVAGELGRKTLLEWRVAELRTQVDELVTKRDELLEEMNAVRERTSELQRIVRQQREAAAASGEAKAGPERGGDEEVVIVPEVAEAADEPSIAVVGEPEPAGVSGEPTNERPPDEPRSPWR